MHRLLVRLSTAAATAALAAMSAAAQELPAVASLVAAENAFAAHSVATDMRQSFIRALGKEGVLLRPHPVNGAAFMQAQPVPPITLNWRPVFATVSASGDIGVTTGPWQITPRGAAVRPPSFGQFISLWRRYPDGEWRLLFDNGIGHPLPTLADAFIEVVNPAGHRADKTKVETTLDRFVAQAAESDYASAVRAHAAAGVRAFRNNVAPFVGRDSLPALPKDSEFARTQLSVVPEVAGVASSGDLLWRLYALRRKPEPRILAYAFTVWRATATGGIELLIDVLTETPPPMPSTAPK